MLLKDFFFFQNVSIFNFKASAKNGPDTVVATEIYVGRQAPNRQNIYPDPSVVVPVNDLQRSGTGGSFLLINFPSSGQASESLSLPALLLFTLCLHN